MGFKRLLWALPAGGEAECLRGAKATDELRTAIRRKAQRCRHRAAWKSKPSWYLVSTEDNMIPPDAQPAMSNALGSTAAEVKGSDHATFRSRGALLSEPLEAVRNLRPCDSQSTTSLPRRPWMDRSPSSSAAAPARFRTACRSWRAGTAWCGSIGRAPRSRIVHGSS